MRDAKEPPAAPAGPASVRLEPPAGYVEMKAIGIIPTAQGNAALLVTEDGGTFLPIFIGETEAASIQHRLDRRAPVRPLTHDLLDTVLKELGGELVKVHVRDLKGGIFFGAVFVRHAGQVVELDARPSDAIALALGAKVPIYVNREVLAAAGMKREDLEKSEGAPDAARPI